MSNLPPNLPSLPTTTAATTQSTDTGNTIPASMTLPSMQPASTTPIGPASGNPGNPLAKAIMNPAQIQRAKMQNVPAFLNKLYNMVDDPSSDELIRWAEDGMSFIVLKHEEFAKRVLPRFFKHSNFSSFVRQLNMYGFHKVPHLQQGVLHADSEAERWEFSNPHFQRNQPDLLLLVTRKKGRDTEDKETGNIDMNHILDEIAAIKKHQMSISADLKLIQRDNQVLWQETIAARERHHRHQETIDKILRFLASVFSSDKKRVAIPRKRRFLIGDANTEYKDEDIITDDEEEDERPTKIPRHFNIDEYMSDNGSTSIGGNSSSNGKASIHSASIGLPYTANAADAIANAAASDAPATELAAAIALNDETKQQQQLQMQQTQLSPSPQGFPTVIQPTHQPLQDLSSVLSLQQLQGLQSLIHLAQTNPGLIQQMANDPFYTSGIPAHLDYPPIDFNLNNNKQEGQQNTTADSSDVSSTILTVAPAPAPTPAPVPATVPASAPAPAPAPIPIPSLPQITNNITSATKSAESISQDIDALGASLGLLTSQLGFDLSKGDHNFINIDDFLNTSSPPATYTVDSPSNTVSASSTPAPTDQSTPSSLVIREETPTENNTKTTTK